MYGCTKTYGHDLGLSATFRQWRATSHCRFLHGYALAFTFEFRSRTLDVNHWVFDFGGLKALKGHLVEAFDHKTVVAEDDPGLDTFRGLHDRGFVDLRILPSVGCEAFAVYAYGLASGVLIAAGEADRVWVERVECREHSGNAATYIGSVTA
jgi:6-pyruvoyltetrahydropterin/6-carboxytetrahydropterin synthase